MGLWYQPFLPEGLLQGNYEPPCNLLQGMSAARGHTKLEDDITPVAYEDSLVPWAVH